MKVLSAEAQVNLLTDKVAKLQRENHDLKAHKVEPKESKKAQTNNEEFHDFRGPEEEKTSQME